MIIGTAETLDALAREFPDVTLGQLAAALHLSREAHETLVAEGAALRDAMSEGGYAGIEAASRLSALTTSAALHDAALSHRLALFVAALHAALPQR